ncbi:MAG: VCBS repeat-containing protein [Deltaproteobacteria bacterium]|nr:VCBS repeat-containing protein [Deltaproteobacteria bacterium]
MKINSNLPSMNIQRQLNLTTTAIARSLQRLSSGSRISSAFDGDTASLSIANKLEAQTRGLLQANQNMNVAQGMLVSAESGMDSQINIVIRMREIAIEAANGTLSTTDRSNLNLELNQLFQEFQRVTNSTEFNGTKLLDGSLGQKALQTTANTQNGQDMVKFEIGNLSAGNVFTRTIGSGTYATAATYGTSTNVYASVAGDFNGDGYQDIAVQNSNSTVSVFINKKDGTFERGVNYTVGATSSAGAKIRAADITGDGILELLTMDSTDATISILKGNGDGTFQARSTKTGYSALEIGDVNGDGKADIVTTLDGASVSVYLGQGGGSFASASSAGPSSGGIGGLSLADINGDGKLDLIYQDNDIASMTSYLGLGNGTFTGPTTWSTMNSTSSKINFGDFNNDGKIDFLAGGYLFKGNGNGTFQTETLVGTGGVDMATGDFNNDGNLDFIEINVGNMKFGTGSGTFTSNGAVSIGSTPSSAIGVDVNNDGALDLISTNNIASGTMTARLANGVSAFTASTIDVSTQTKAQSLLTIIDNALGSLKTEQAKIAGLHSRLDVGLANNLLLSENLSEARSRTRDVDVALETAELVRNQVLQQAQVSVLTQANVQWQSVAELLKFN